LGETTEQSKFLKMYKNRLLWPGYRVAKVISNEYFYIDILEPAYYWRIERDYSSNNVYIPDPVVVSIAHPKEKMASSNNYISMILNELTNPKIMSQPRVVLHLMKYDDQFDESAIKMWSKNSVGLYGRYEDEKKDYNPLPSLSTSIKNDLLTSLIQKNVRNCIYIFQQPRGNRSCFDKCK
jgi:hypothetical protein